MKNSKSALYMLVFLLFAAPILRAGKQAYNPAESTLLPYVVENGDTVYLAPIKPARVYEKKKRNKGRAWRKYYKLVYNFAAVYPYALVAKDVILQADSTIKAEDLKYVRKDRYVDGITKELFRAFEKPMKHLTVTQGQLLMKLIDRECGITSYVIIHDFKNKYAAGFWQGIAKMFGSDLKKPYDPTGDDSATEELVHQWENGTFEQTYYEIFWEYPPMMELPEKYNRPNVNTPNAGKSDKTQAVGTASQKQGSLKSQSSSQKKSRK